MRKPALFAAAILLSVSSVFAQASGGASANGTDKNFHFGLNVMPGLFFAVPGSSNTTGSTTIANSANGAGFGFGYGVNLEFYFTQNYGLATGIEVNQFGVNYTNITTVKSGTVTDSSINTAHVQSMQYLQIPLLLKLRTNAIGPIKYFGQFGLGTGFLLSAKDNPTETRTVGATTFPASTTSNNNIYKQSDFIRLGLNVGLGMEYSLAGSTSIQVSLNYDNAFTNVNSDGNNSVLAKGVTLVVGVLF
ncbi:MAG TPA: porin family protein [Bacteroidia bacterium]|jgi:hypothetical protein|nr:porin family protein [Bacteroidia bacterium]